MVKTPLITENQPNKIDYVKQGFTVYTYRVINKEGHKVLGYKTSKKCDFDALKKFIASKNMGHFDI